MKRARGRWWRAARATPDGYTLTIGHWGTHVLNGAVYSMQYDVLNDFEPVGRNAVLPTATGTPDGNEPPPEELIVSESVDAWS